MSNKRKITPRSEDYSEWYLDIIASADLAENSPVRGSMVIKPYGFALWENIKGVLDAKIKETGHQNAYFPLLIPKSLLTREAQHIEGFATESAVVTHYRLKAQSGEMVVDPEAKLTEELIIRPTSETIIYETFKNWIHSWRDLPLLINQWVNVMRWEMRTRPFLRTSEFLWQEGHTAHTTNEDAKEEQMKMLEMYRSFVEEYLALPVVMGKKSESEKFAGADSTFTIEALMQDGKALQAATSHNLGQNFAKAFDITYRDQNEEMQYVWQTSWGMSTRIIGALLMVHGDDSGVVMPPKIAPIQVVIVPIWKNDEEKKKIMSVIENVIPKLPVRTKVDDRDYLSVGEKFFEWEKKGVPVRIEIGVRDLESNEVVLVRRDNGEKGSVPLESLPIHIEQVLDTVQRSLFSKAKQFLADNTHEVDSYDLFKSVLEEKGGFVRAYWDGTEETEKKIKEETGATIRCLPFEESTEEGECIYTGKKTHIRALFAKAY